MRQHHVHFYVCFSQERTLSGKRWVTASLAEPEGIADVTSTETQHFWPSTLAKPVDASRSKHMQPQDSVRQRIRAHVDLTHMRNITDTHRPLACRTSKMASQTKAQRNQRHLCQHIEKWSRLQHQRRSMPFDSTVQQHAIRDQDTQTVHDVRSRAACLSQEMAAENSRGAWARISLTSSTQTSPANKFPDLSRWRVRATLMLTLASAIKWSVCRYDRQSGDQALRWPCRTHAIAGNGLKSSSAVSFPSNFHTLKREIVENGCRPHGSLRSRTSQSNARGPQQHSVRLAQKLGHPSVDVRFVQEHVATVHTVVTCLKLKSRDTLTRALHNLCDDVSS